MSNINKASPERVNGNHRHRKEKSRSPRGSLRPEVQIPGGQTRGRGHQDGQSGNRGQRSTRHGAVNEPKKHRSPDQLGNRNHSSASQHNGLANHPLRSKITPQQAQDLLEKLAQEFMVNNPNIIMRVGEEIRAFGKYTIRKDNHTYQIFRGATLAAQPSSSKVAISWCVADKYCKVALSVELLQLDQEIERRTNELIYYQTVQKKTQDSLRWFVMSDRIQECQLRLRLAKEQLDKCLNSAKYWQLKGFKDETARIGIKNQNTTK